MRTVRSISRLSLRVCLSACWDTSPPGSRHPPGPGTPQTRHSPGSRHPPRPVTRHAGIPPAMHAGIAHPLETCCKPCSDTTCKACWDTTPPVDRMTDTCKNITFATSLRTVIMINEIKVTDVKLLTEGPSSLVDM